MEGTTRPDLQETSIRAVVDFVKIATPKGKVPLPQLRSLPKWSRSEGYRSLTFHDFDSRDLVALPAEIRKAEVIELEIAIDFSPRYALDRREVAKFLRGWHRYISQRLYPFKAPFMSGAKVRSIGAKGKPTGFNNRVPSVQESLLWHLRRDSVVQVKAYAKVRDQGRFIGALSARARVEVTAKELLCRQWGVIALQDISELAVRKQVSKYFAFARDIKRAKMPRRRSGSVTMNEHLLEMRAEEAVRRSLKRWGRFGVEGVTDWHGVLPVMDSSLNQRVGKALADLERRLDRAVPTD